MASVFLSHSSHDKNFVRKLAADLREHGHEPWLDEDEIRAGECIVSKLQQGLDSADFVILVITPEAVDSGWVDREWKAAYWSAQRIADNKVIPLLLRPCTIPTFLGSIRHADCASNYESGFREVLAALRTHQENPSLSRKTIARYQKLAVAEVKIQLEIVSAGELISIEVSPTLLVAELKREIRDNFASRVGWLHGNAYLYSKTQKRRLDNLKTLEENNVAQGEIIRLGFEFFLSA